MAKEYVCLYHSFLDVIQPLADDERGRLLTAILIYGKTGQEPEMTGNERFVFPAIRSQIDRDAEKYKDRCNKNAQNVMNRWNGPRSDDTNVYDPIRPNTNAYETYQEKGKNKDKCKCEDKGKGEKGVTKGAQDAPKSARFIKPTVEQVAEYCQERGNGIDPEEFIDHYETNGWMRGKTPVKDWKACVRTWERSRRNNGFNATRPAPQAQNTGNVFFDMLREEGGL